MKKIELSEEDIENICMCIMHEISMINVMVTKEMASKNRSDLISGFRHNIEYLEGLSRKICHE